MQSEAFGTVPLAAHKAAARALKEARKDYDAARLAMRVLCAKADALAALYASGELLDVRPDESVELDELVDAIDAARAVLG